MTENSGITMTLTQGNYYEDVPFILKNFASWSDDGAHEGKSVADYFNSEGMYRGPDENDVEPEFWM